MTYSSGVHAYPRDEHLTCLACDYTGVVEVWRDDELRQLAWTCPRCTTETEEEI